MPIRKLIRSLAFSAIALYLTTKIIPGFQISTGVGNLIIATLALTLLNLIVRPVVKLFLLPINLITLGAFGWLAAVIILYLLTWIIPEVQISSFPLNRIAVIGFFLPALTVGKFFATLLTALTTTTIRRLLIWLTRA